VRRFPEAIARRVGERAAWPPAVHGVHLLAVAASARRWGVGCVGLERDRSRNGVCGYAGDCTGQMRRAQRGLVHRLSAKRAQLGLDQRSLRTQPLDLRMQPVAPLRKLGTCARSTSRWSCIRRNKAREGSRTDGEEQHASAHFPRRFVGVFHFFFIMNLLFVTDLDASSFGRHKTFITCCGSSGFSTSFSS
jgi:hypothetical protein